MDRGPVTDFIFKRHMFMRHVSIHTIDNCLKLKLSGTCSSTLGYYSLSKGWGSSCVLWYRSPLEVIYYWSEMTLNYLGDKELASLW
jgi:hypothetical protein